MAFTKNFGVPFALLVLACGSEDDVGRIVLVDAGELCMFGSEPSAFSLLGGGEQSFAAGERLYVDVAVPGCLSASCDVEREASCAIARSGATLTVSSELGYREVDAPSCTMDCGMLHATCASDPLEAGAYTVVHGEQSFALAVPSQGEACR